MLDVTCVVGGISSLAGGSGATSFGTCIFGVGGPLAIADDANDATVGEFCLVPRPRVNETLRDAGLELAALKGSTSKLDFSNGELWPLKLALASGDGWLLELAHPK